MNRSEAQRKYSINENFFDNIDSEEKAYFLGFLYADGTISSKRNTVLLSLKEDDKEILEKLKIAIGYSGPLKYRIRNPNWKGAKIGSKNIWNLHITNKRLREKLEKLGCTNNRTFTANFPDISEILISHFVRGYFDGDGCIYYSLSHKLEWSIIGTENFVRKVQEILTDKLSLNKNKLHKRGKLFYLKYGSLPQVIKLRE